MLERKRNRLKEFDYSQTGYYFVTICTSNMIEYLSKVINSKLVLNTYGNIVLNNLNNLQVKYSYVELDEFIIMPNHVHAIIIIDKSNIGVVKARVPSSKNNEVQNSGISVTGRDPMLSG